jgi:hypothetical protein
MKRITARKATELTMLEVQNSDDPVFLLGVFAALVALLDGKKSMRADTFHDWLNHIFD